ncbi:hypothetical protein [Streptomyces sp. NPDC005485]|uniref:hypothetical protein n=1 Tax=Streptomyces sp. NPDC005485 TaxID=3155591 RepID=UPI0033ABFA5E
MTDDQLCEMSAIELARAIREREVSPVEAVEAVLARIERVNPLVRPRDCSHPMAEGGCQ